MDFYEKLTQTSHAVSVTPFGKVSLEGFRSSIGLIATDLAFVIDIETVKFVQPIGDWFPIPAEGQIFRVVNNVILFLFVL